MWHPRNTGRPIYHFNKKSTTTTTTTTSTKTNHTLAAVNPITTSNGIQPSSAAPNGAIAAPPSKPSSKPSAPIAYSTPTTDNFYSPSGSPYQLDLNSALRRVPTPWAELARYTKIVRRLKWKLPFLAYGYNAATDQTADITDEQRDEAELMFKLDFFDYYMLLERAMVHMLGVFGIKVTGGLGGRLGGGRNGHHRADSGRGGEQSEHRFHANVLEAFHDPSNPLHEVLGKDDVCFALSRAKERACHLEKRRLRRVDWWP